MNPLEMMKKALGPKKEEKTTGGTSLLPKGWKDLTLKQQAFVKYDRTRKAKEKAGGLVREVTGGLSGNAHQRRVAKRKAAGKPEEFHSKSEMKRVKTMRGEQW